MVRINVNTGRSSGGVGVSQSRIRRFTPRQLETDAQTRTNERREVTMLPASTAIINVYQLVNKTKRGGAAEKRSGKAIRTSMKGASGAGSTRVSRVAVGPSHFLKGRFIDSGYNLVPIPNEKNYNELNKEYRAKELALKAKNEAVEEESERAAAGERQANFNAETEAAVKFAQTGIAKARAESPKAEVLQRVKQLRIPYTEKVGNYERDGRYRRKDITDPDDLKDINKAIDNAVSEGRMGEVPPPIVAVGTRMGSLGTTQAIYIKKDLSILRRKKMMRSKAKRPMTHGKKKHVVIKHKKGGKR